MDNIYSVGKYLIHSQELEDKTDLELLGEEYFNDIEKRHSKIIGMVRSIVYSCKYENKYCECGGVGNNYCPDCGKELIFSSKYPEYTEYPIKTAQNQEMARDIFAQEYDIENTEYIKIKKYLFISCFFDKESYLKAKKAQDDNNIGYKKHD